MAFLKRDFENASSYKLSLILETSGLVTSVFTFYFISRLIGNAGAEHLEIYGANYFSFVLIGMAFSAYFWNQLGIFAGTIMTGQMSGTLEIMLTTPTKIPMILVASSAYRFLHTTVITIVYLLTGSLLGVNFSLVNIPAALVVFILTMLTFSALGLMSAAFILVFKRGDPVAWFLGSMGTLLGGAMFPVTVLPMWLQKISEFIPITHALRAMRLALLQGYSISLLAKDIFVLVIFALILLPLSLSVINLAVRKAKKDGSLFKY